MSAIQKSPIPVQTVLFPPVSAQSFDQDDADVAVVVTSYAVPSLMPTKPSDQTTVVTSVHVVTVVATTVSSSYQ
jgi:hypothetical protein